MPWPQDALPAGAFGKIADLTTAKRVVALPIDANEAVLASKITGPGQRATLSAVLQEGMKAVTIRVNDVEGVAGFVLPGDHVDVVLTRQIDKENATNDVVDRERAGACRRSVRGCDVAEAFGGQGGDAGSGSRRRAEALARFAGRNACRCCCARPAK